MTGSLRLMELKTFCHLVTFIAQRIINTCDGRAASHVEVYSTYNYSSVIPFTFCKYTLMFAPKDAFLRRHLFVKWHVTIIKTTVALTRWLS